MLIMDIILNFYDNFILVICLPIISILILNNTSRIYYYQENGVVLTSAGYFSKVKFLLFLNFIILISWPVIVINTSLEDVTILKILQFMLVWFIAFGFLLETRKTYPHAPHEFLKALESHRK